MEGNLKIALRLSFCLINKWSRKDAKAQ